MVPIEVGNAIRDRRLQLGLTQAAVAAQIRRTRAYVSAIEHGVSWDPDADILVVIAETLHWPPAYLLRMLDREPVPSLPLNLRTEVVALVHLVVREQIAAALAERGCQVAPATTGAP